MALRALIIELRDVIHAAHCTKVFEGHRTEDLVVVIRSTQLTIGTVDEWRTSSDPARDLTYHRDFPAAKPHHLRTIVDLPTGPAFVALDTEPRHAVVV